MRSDEPIDQLVPSAGPSRVRRAQLQLLHGFEHDWRRMATRLLVGRDIERRKLRDALESACSGTGRVILLDGDAGIGKSALIRDLEDHARARCFPMHIGYCVNSDTPAAYGPWIELTSIARLSGESPTGIVAGLAGDPGSTDIFVEIERLITSAHSERPVVLVLEDLHWADQASLNLFLALSRHIDRMPALLIATYRPFDAETKSPFAQALPEFHRLHQAVRIELAPLDLSPLIALARERYKLSPADSGRLGRYLLRYAGGNPFYTSELLQTLENQRLVVERGGRFEVGQLHEAVIPPIVDQLVQSRIAEIDESLQRHFQTAAVLGERFSFDQWLAICDVDEEDLKQVTTVAIDARILAPSTNRSTLAFNHALIQEALYQTLPSSERGAIHRRIGEMLINQAETDADAIAHHLSQCESPEAVDWLIEAGARAYYAHAWVVARERFREALSKMPANSADPERRAWLLYRLAMTERWEHELTALQHLEESENLAQSLEDRLLEAYCSFFQGSVYWFRNECARARPFLDASIEMLKEAPAGGDVSRFATTLYGYVEEEGVDLETFNPIEGSITIIFASAGWHRDAVASGRAFLDAYGEVDIESRTAAKTYGDVYAGLGLSLAVLGKPAEASLYHGKAAEAYDLPNLASLARLHLVRNVLVPYFTTERREIEHQKREIERIHDSIEGLFTFDFRLMAATGQHRLMLLEGDWNAAEKHATYGLELLKSAYRDDAATTLAELARLRGCFVRAWELIGRVLLDGPDEQPGSMRYLVGLYVAHVAANLALDENNVAVARQWIDAHARWLGWGDAHLGQAEHRLLEARYQLMLGDAEGAEAFAREAFGVASDPEQPLALVASRRMLGSLARKTGRHEEAAEHLAVALDLARKSEARYQAALVEIEQLALSTAPGTTVATPDDPGELRDYLESIGARPALERLATIEERYLPVSSLPNGFASLTPRELDVLRMVASGFPNAEIADRLSISPRTVTTHLSSIYRKLDTSSRTAITRIAIEHGLTQ